MFQVRRVGRCKGFLRRTHKTYLAAGVVLLALFPAVLSAQEPSNPFCGPFEKVFKAEFAGLIFKRNDDYGNECQMTMLPTNSRNIMVEVLQFSSKKQAKKEMARSFDIFSLGYEMRSGGTYRSYSTSGFWSDAMVLNGRNDDSVILLRIDNYVLTVISLDSELLLRTETALRNRTLYK